MPFGIILLHLALISAAILLLALLCSTRNWEGLLPATAWVAVDLLVSVTGTVLSLRPDYASGFAPAMLRAHLLFFALAVAWMALDAWRGSHPLAAIFAYCFAAVFGCRCFEILAYRWRMLPAGPLEAINAVVYLGAVLLLVSALLLPVPPVPEKTAPEANAAPRTLAAPALAREFRS